MSTTTDLSKELPELDHRIGTAGALSSRNILINGDMRINQRGFDGNWSLLANLAFGYDRWFKADASNISQAVESGNFKPSTTYTLSGTNVTTQQLTSPATGNWVITVPNDATNVQLEEGSVSTPFELRNKGTEIALCQRYYWASEGLFYMFPAHQNSSVKYVNIAFPQPMRATPSVNVSFSSVAGGGSSTITPYKTHVQIRHDDTDDGVASLDSPDADAEITS